ncbi:sulfatase-like hydrolase/transferase [Streptomyces sp. SID3343]|uniref:sulfatase-like hydrolase/transferase n=1 Tax=Streptomyces sp. SID3343 TaxID=2690260 RepID=UPI00136CF6DC|nr:sulfatase-like hydrolase/transferase [Streptomyces sp. SID3343]MYW05577.1 sulfatase-like hydrolase/transferase [Streptomyces sp. SID3343]
MPSNILVFLTDDHAQWAAGCYGNSEVRTPTLDHLAETGVVFDNAYTPSPVCSPARASFFTGRMPSQHGVHDYLAEADEDVRATPWLSGEKLISEILREQGYFTGLSGKWHLGHGEHAARGFDYWYSRAAPVSEAEGYEAPWPLTKPAEKRYDRHAITDHAIEFLRNRDAGKPFFLVVGHLATHSPWTGAPERLVSHYRRATFADIPNDVTHPHGRLRSESLYPTRDNPREALAQYYGAVTDIDEQVGRIVDELDTLDIRDDTLVVYTSDHGLNTGHHGIWGKGNGTLPYNVLDESIRIPLIVNHRGSVLGGQRRRENVGHVDTFRTLLETAGAQLPDTPSTPYPGTSYRSALLGRTMPEARPLVFAEYGNLRMVRSDRFKLVRRHAEGPHEMYDLRADPRETDNVIDDPTLTVHRDRLDEEMRRYFATYEEPGRAGTHVLEQPRHNGDEAWRETKPPVLVETSEWLVHLEDAIQERRRLRTEEHDALKDAR